MATDEQDKVAEATVAKGQWSANISVYTLQNPGGAMRRLMGEWFARNVGFCAYGAGVGSGVVEFCALCGRLDSFYAYVTH
jgi:hypothetical protein